MPRKTKTEAIAAPAKLQRGNRPSGANQSSQVDPQPELDSKHAAPSRAKTDCGGTTLTRTRSLLGEQQSQQQDGQLRSRDTQSKPTVQQLRSQRSGSREANTAEPDLEPGLEPEPESHSETTAAIGVRRFSNQGWTFRDDGLLVREENRDVLYTIEGFDGDYESLASEISDHVVASLERSPLNLQRLKLGATGHRGVSQHVYMSSPKAGQSSSAPMLVLVPGIGTRAGVWGRSLCATAGLEAGSMRAFIRIARERGFGRIVLLDPNDSADPFDGECHSRHCVLAWKELVEDAAPTCEVFAVAHSYGGAALIDMLAVASEHALARVRGIAFTDSVHHVQPGCVQLSDDAKATLSGSAMGVLSKHGKLWLADEAPVDTELFGGGVVAERGCRCVSAGTCDHAGTNPAAMASIFAWFAASATR